MCVKNLNRQGGLIGAALAVQAEVVVHHPPQAQQQQQQQQQSAQCVAPHNKQFQCPFCDKSYSWKQTLKQVGVHSDNLTKPSWDLNSQISQEAKLVRRVGLWFIRNTLQS